MMKFKELMDIKIDLDNEIKKIVEESVYPLYESALFNKISENLYDEKVYIYLSSIDYNTINSNKSLISYYRTSRDIRFLLYDTTTNNYKFKEIVRKHLIKLLSENLTNNGYEFHINEEHYQLTVYLG